MPLSWRCCFWSYHCLWYGCIFVDGLLVSLFLFCLLACCCLFGWFLFVCCCCLTFFFYYFFLIFNFYWEVMDLIFFFFSLFSFFFQYYNMKWWSVVSSFFLFISFSSSSPFFFCFFIIFFSSVFYFVTTRSRAVGETLNSNIYVTPPLHSLGSQVSFSTCWKRLSTWCARGGMGSSSGRSWWTPSHSGQPHVQSSMLSVRDLSPLAVP